MSDFYRPNIDLGFWAHLHESNGGFVPIGRKYKTVAELLLNSPYTIACVIQMVSVTIVVSQLLSKTPQACSMHSMFETFSTDDQDFFPQREQVVRETPNSCIWLVE